MEKPGYQLPIDIPVNLACYKVYIPDCPEALLALKGSFDFLCKWVAWEKTVDHRALVMAQMFKQADVLSWLQCQEDNDMCTCDEIRLIVREEIENMAITNNLYCGCGCGNSGNSQSQYPPVLPPGDTGFPTQPPSTGEDPGDLWKCQASNQAADNYEAFWLQIFNVMEQTDITTDMLTALAASYALTAPLAILIQMISILAGYSAQVAQQVANIFDATRDDLQQAMFDATNPLAAYNACYAIIQGASGTWYAKALALYTLQMADWETLFNVDSFSITGVYDCVGGTPSDLPAGYIRVPAPIYSFGLIAPDIQFTRLVGIEGYENVGQMVMSRRWATQVNMNMGYVDSLGVVQAGIHPEEVGFEMRYQFNIPTGGYAKVFANATADSIESTATGAIQITTPNNGSYRARDGNADTPGDIVDWTELAEVFDNPSQGLQNNFSLTGFQTYYQPEVTPQMWAVFCYWIVPDDAINIPPGM